MRRHPFIAIIAASLTFATAAPAEAALVFDFRWDVGVPTYVQDGMIDAGTYWSGVLSDSVTVRYDVAWAPLGAGVLGGASSYYGRTSYTNVRNALTADTSSADDTTFTSNLPVGSVPVYINRTSDSPNGSGSATPYLDNDGSANNTDITLTRSNLKALGLLTANDTTSSDADITFNSSYGGFDFDRSDGIAAGMYDFVGVAIHEIGHALGFVSGVDQLDYGPGGGEDTYNWLSVLDLGRYSEDSAALGAVDFTADTRAKVWSLDSGTSYLTGSSFATGVNFGDGGQNSHWKDNAGIGLMDPTATPGTQMDATASDLRAIDVIGWDLVSALSSAPTTLFSGGGGAMTPEPMGMGYLAALALALHLTGRRPRARASS